MNNNCFVIKFQINNPIHFPFKVKVLCSYDNKKWFAYYDYHNYDYICDNLTLPIDMNDYSKEELENFKTLNDLIKEKGNYINDIYDNKIKYLLILLEEKPIKNIYSIDTNIKNSSDCNVDIKVSMRNIYIKSNENIKKLKINIQKGVK